MFMYTSLKRAKLWVCKNLFEARKDFYLPPAISLVSRSEEAVSYKGGVFPRGLKYSAKHSWVKDLGGGRVRVGVTDYAQKKLKAVVYVEPPQVGARVEAGSVLASLESIKAVVDVYAPVSGRVAAYNERLDDDPGLINRDPYGEGWIAELEVDDVEELEKLLTIEEYIENVLKKEEKI